MNDPLVTISITTYERPALAKVSLHSVCNQSYRNLSIAVFDNSTKDDIADIVTELADDRISYERNPPNIRDISLINHRKAFRPRGGKYHMVLSSDAALDKDAIEDMVAMLEREPRISFVITKTCSLDIKSGVRAPLRAAEYVRDGEGTRLIDSRATIHAAFAGTRGVGVIYHSLIVSDVLTFGGIEKVYFNQSYEHHAGLELMLQNPAFGYIDKPLLLWLDNDERWAGAGYRNSVLFSEAAARAKFFEKNYLRLLSFNFDISRMRRGLFKMFFRCARKPNEQPFEAAVYAAKYGLPILAAATAFPILFAVGKLVQLFKRASKTRASF